MQNNNADAFTKCDHKFAKCINNDEESKYLILGKYYQIIAQDSRHYKIRTEMGNIFGYFKHRFQIVTDPKQIRSIAILYARN